MRRRTTSETEAPLDLTPMIDVVFLLLIFFLTTLSFRVLEGKLPTFLPKDIGQNAGPAPELLEPLEITIREAPGGAQVRVGSWSIAAGWSAGRRDVAAGVAEVVRRFRASDPDVRGRLSVDPAVDYEAVVTVVDGCLAGGLREITFAGG